MAGIPVVSLVRISAIAVAGTIAVVAALVSPAVAVMMMFMLLFTTHGANQEKKTEPH